MMPVLAKTASALRGSGFVVGGVHPGLGLRGSRVYVAQGFRDLGASVQGFRGSGAQGLSCSRV